MIMPTAIIFLAVGRNGLARPCAARRGHLCRLPTEAAFPVILPVPFAAAAPHSPEGGQALTNQEIIPCPPYSRSASSLLFSGSSCALFRIENLSNGSVASLLQCQARAQLLRVGLREFWTASRRKLKTTLSESLSREGAAAGSRHADAPECSMNRSSGCRHRKPFT
jgi:hypothetical protein